MKELAFSIPIYKYKVQNWEVKKKKLLNLFNSFEHKVIGNVITSPLNIKTNILDEEIVLFENEYSLKLISTEVWFQEYKKNMNHSVHNHGSTGFSSVCFIEYEKKYHKPTTFVSPFCNCITGEFERYEPDVEEGDIIFFPVNLLHYVPVNLMDKTRIVLSINFLLDTNRKNSNGLIYR